MNNEQLQEMKRRELYVERALAIVTIAAQPPNPSFLSALEQFIEGTLSLEVLERNVDILQYLDANR